MPLRSQLAGSDARYLVRMTRAHLALLLLPAACASLPSDEGVRPAAHSNRLALLAGVRELGDDYEPVEVQTMLGLEYAHEAPGALVGFEAGIAGSASEDEQAGVDVEGSTLELYAGVRKTFGDDQVRPYVGLGAALIRTAIDPDDGPVDDGGSLAGYAHGGAELWLGPNWFAGLDLRFVFASDIEYVARDTDGDYGQLALFVGFGF